MSLQTPDYLSTLNFLKEKIRHARIRAAIGANGELLKLYWEIGNQILVQQSKKGWGSKIIDRLAADLKVEFPDFKGLSLRNLKYMRAFAESNAEFVQVPLAQLTWYHHITLLDKVKDKETRLFYMYETIQNGWSRDIMVLQIENGFHIRQGKAISNFSQTLPDIQSDLAQQTLKNPYVFDFLSATEEMKERDLEKALIKHLKDFMLELGKGFAYVGNQKNIMVDGDDFFLDLLFYNFHLHCFVVFELKIGDFKPEYAGKLNFYINAINGQLKGPADQPTIGVLLCKTRNETVIKYSLKGIDTPIGVSDYTLASALPKQLKSEMPTIEELESELEKEYQELQKPVDKKLQHVKKLLSSLKQPEVKEKRSHAACLRILNKVVFPLRIRIKKQLKENQIISLFENTEILIWTGSQGHKTNEEAKNYLNTHKEVSEFRIEIQLLGCKLAGTRAFNIYNNLYIKTYDRNYIVGSDSYQSQNIFTEKLYHTLPEITELEEISNKCVEAILDDISENIERIKRS